MRNTVINRLLFALLAVLIVFTLGAATLINLATQVKGILAVANGGTGVTSAQGNGSKVQLSTGSPTSGNCGKFDANGNIVDAGTGCSTGGGGGTGGLTPLAISTQPDWPPVSPNAMDDEFTGGTFNAGSIWTAVNIGTCTMTQNNNSWLLFSCPSNGGAQNLRLQCQTLPSAPYEFEAKMMHDYVTFNGNSGFQYYGGIILRESGTGKHITWSFDGGHFPRVVYWSALGTDVSVLFGYSNTWNPDHTPIYFKVGRSGTTLTWKIADSDGANFRAVYTESLTTHFTTAPDQVCIGNSPYGNTVVSAYDFFRRTQ